MIPYIILPVDSAGFGRFEVRANGVVAKIRFEYDRGRVGQIVFDNTKSLAMRPFAQLLDHIPDREDVIYVDAEPTGSTSRRFVFSLSNSGLFFDVFAGKCEFKADSGSFSFDA